MWKSAFAIVIACMASGAASAQDAYLPDPQKIDSMTRNCVYNNAFYSQGAIVCLGAGRGLQCSAGSWIIIQDAASCREQVPAQPPLLR
jgi:hypothetical protein